MKNLADLTQDEVQRLSREKTAFFFSLGPLEEHGPHLPLGTAGKRAGAEAEAVAEVLEKEGWTIIAMPGAALGIESNTSRFAIRVRAHVLRDYLVDCCTSLAKAGFRHFACFSGHPGPRQLTAIEEAGKILRKRHSRFGMIARKNCPTLSSVDSVLIADPEMSRNSIFPDFVEHGGAYETSIALAAFASEVRPEYSAMIPVERQPSAWEHYLKWKRGEVAGYWGDPSKASAEEGRKILVERALASSIKLRTVWEGANPNFIFRSWYSIYPPNQSLFKIWMLLFGLMAVLAAWIYLAFSAMLKS